MANELHHEWIGGIFSGYVCKRCGQKKSAASIGVCPGFVAEYSSEGSQPIGAIKATNGPDIIGHQWTQEGKKSYCIVCTAKVDGPGSYDPCPGRLTDWSANEPYGEHYGASNMGHQWVKNERGAINCKFCNVSWGTLAATQICQPPQEKAQDKPSAFGNGWTGGQKVKWSTQLDPTSWATTGYVQTISGISNEEMRRIRNSALDLAVRSIPAMQPPSSNLGMRIEAHNPAYILSVAKIFEAYLKDGTTLGKDTPPEENSK